MMRIAYTSDLHGYPSLYEAFFALAEAERADAWIIGGDLSPHGRAYRWGLDDQREFFTGYLIPLLRAWTRRHPRVRGFLILGNDDWAPGGAYLDALDHEQIAVSLHGRVAEIGEGFRIAGYSYVPVTPFGIKDWEKFDRPDGKISRQSRTDGLVTTPEGFRAIDLREWRPASRTSIAADLTDLVGSLEPSRTVLVIHTPPYGTKLDVLYNRLFVGSRAVRNMIETRQPYLTLHGHIHESPRMSGAFIDRLGATVCVNPGQSVGLEAAGSIQAVVFELDDPANTIRHTRVPRSPNRS